MCGIIAIAGKNIPESIKGSLETLSRRGPDEQGTLRFPSCILGHTRLSILDITGGHQPMRDEKNDTAISFNGEIYNYKETRKELETKGHRFTTNSDTEVILKAYAQWGDQCPKHLDGMFAFAIWDEPRQRLFMARDRFGKKPLYYGVDDDTFFCASEIKALHASGRIKGELSRTALDNYLRLMYLPPWKSIYKNIGQLPPAHSATFAKGTLKIARYWHLEFKPLDIGYDEAKEEVRRLLTEAVKKRMLTADVEVGALLSGGVDSTFICLLAQEYLNHPLKTFSLGYGDYINELPFAQNAAEKIGSEHYTMQASGDLVEELEKIIGYFDEPHADSSDFPQSLISGLAASKVKVALSGDGGDELFMGYGWHARHKNLSYKAHTFEKLFLNPLQGRVRATRVFKPLERLALWGSLAPLNEDIYAKDVYSGSLDPMQKIIAFDLTTYLPGQLLSKVDRTGMMHSLEVRSPFLDTALAEFVCNLPTEYKLSNKGHKLILKDLLSEYMPKEFVNRRKQGFGAPVGKWLREKKMREYTLEQLNSRAEICSLLNGKVINFFLKDFYERGHDRAGLRIWILLCLQIWLRSNKISND